MTNKFTNLKIYFLLVIASMVFCVGLFLVLKNIRLRKTLDAIESPLYSKNFDERVNEQKQSNPNVMIVNNNNHGIWDKDEKRQVRFVQELSIWDDQDDQKVFYRAGPVKADAKGDIYVGQFFSEGTIRKFDSGGNYLLNIGKKGQGPGEFYGLPDFVFEKDSILTVFDAGTQRITRFSLDGKYLNSMLLELENVASPIGVHSFIVDDKGFYYMSFYASKLDMVIHKFSPQGNYITSFGRPLHNKDSNGIISMTLMRNNFPGRLAYSDKDIFFSQSNPYELRKFNTKGKLEIIAFRKNSFMPPARIEIEGGSYRARVPALSSALGIWRNMLINCVWVPPYISKKTGTVIDFFNQHGQLLTSITLKERINFNYIDKYGKIYGIEIDDNFKETIVRYAIKLNQHFHNQ